MVLKKPWSVGKEKALLNAWLWDKHRSDPQWRRVRLGVLPTKESNRIYMTILKWADAVFLHRGIVYIVEAKIRPNFGAIGQLEGYADLFHNTLEFSNYKEWPVKLILLTTVVDLNTVELASKKGIQYEVFTMDDVNRVRRELLQPVLLDVKP